MAFEEFPFSVDVAWVRKTATVAISGEVDLCTAPELDECLVEVVARRPDRVVVDLAQLHFIDCSGAAVLDRAGRHYFPRAAPWSCVPPTGRLALCFV